MINYEFAEKVADIVIQRLKEERLIRPIKKNRVKSENRVMRQMIRSFDAAIEKTGGGPIGENTWRDTYAEMFNAKPGNTRMIFSRYRDSIVEQGLVSFDGFSFHKSATKSATENVTKCTNEAFSTFHG